MGVLKNTMPPDKRVASRVGIVGLGGSDESLKDGEFAEEEEEFNPRDLGDEPAGADGKFRFNGTVVEAVTILLPRRQGSSPVVEALIRCMDSLAEFSRVYRLANNIPAKVFTYERLPAGGVYWTTRKLLDEAGDQWDEGMELLLFPLRLPARTQHEDLDVGALQRLSHYFEQYLGGHPLAAYIERRLEARIAFDQDGDYAACVIQVQIAMEALFDGLLALLLWEEGRLPRRAAEDVFSGSLHRRLRKEFPPRLGGDWNTRGGGPLGRWAQEIVPLRNRIVHAAHRPTRLEAVESLNILGEVDEFVKQRLVLHRNDYVRSVLMFLGQTGLAERGALTRRIKVFVEVDARREPSWLDLFRAWHEQVLGLRESFKTQGR